MDSAYDRKFDEMKKYIPFLESMIKRLESTGSSSETNPRQAQLDKIRSLRDLLLNKNKRMKMENLLKCEQVLVNLYAKVERDSFSNTKPVTEKQPTTSKEKLELETVRNKLKTVAKIQDGAETLPEIARANDIELNYTGSKEPALFQRRPNKSSKSPMSSLQRTSNDAQARTSLQHKRNYTRVLLSPDRSPSRWPTPEQSSSEKPLFSRRSPLKTISSPIGKKDKKKSKASKSRKTNDLNITLNVPQESLNSLNTKDILSRIINCKDGDVDIDTLRELRTQILGELKQTGKNDDISELILKSYNIQSDPIKNKTRKHSKEDVEEGELSDSESEAIESIYGSLPKMDKDKKSSTLEKTVENKDQRKIQICFVISDKVEPKDKTSKPSQVIDLVSELENYSENETDKSKEIILLDSDTSSSPPKRELIKNQTSVDIIAKRKIDITPPEIEMNSEKVSSECITLDDDNNEELKDQTIEINRTEESDDPSLDNHKKESVESKELSDSSVSKTDQNLTINCNAKTQNNVDLKHNQNTEKVTAELLPKFVANFYKPIEEHTELTANSRAVTNNLQEKDFVPENIIVTEQPRCVTSAEVINNSLEKRNAVDINNDTVTSTSEKQTSNKVSTCLEKEKRDDSQHIPLLNEPTVPPKAKTSVLSEIDILQALKNEILSGSISMPGTEVVTPALHQPKLTKVANAQEIMPKKTISIEKYKEKVLMPKPLFFKKRRRRARRNKDDINKKQSLKLTDKECERFNFPKRLSLDDDDDDINEMSDVDFLTVDKDKSFGFYDIYGDLAPKSPDDVNKTSNVGPIIIPTDTKSFEVSSVMNKNDVDMRALLPTPLLPQPISQSVASPFIPSMGCGTVPPSSAYGIDRNLGEAHVGSSKKVGDINITKFNTLDPRKRRDLNISVMNSPNPYAATNPEIMPRSFASLVASTPNMTPSRTPNMTPSYSPSMPQLRTPNARNFEMTPSHQTFELEEQTARKHVYAPLFPMSDNRERESSVPKDVPYWDMNKSDTRNRTIRWEESNKHTGGPKWEDRDPRSNSGQHDGSYTPRHDDLFKSKYDNRIRGDKYNTQDCPTTPVPSFGWSECPLTPSSAFGRQEAPMTPSHPFGRSDCPTTPVHPFGRGDSTPNSGFGRNVDMASNHSYTRSECPPTPSHSFGRSDCPPTPTHPFGRNECPLTPSHPFGRNECPRTPSHPFGRSECPRTPSHPFGRSDCPRTPSHPFGRSESIPYNNRPDILNNSNQTYSKDPRLNRRAEYESSSYNQKDCDYRNERDGKSSSYKSQSKYYSGPDTSRSYERERSVGRNDRDYGDRNAHQYDRNRRDVSIGPSTSRDEENDRLYSRNRESRYDKRFSKDHDDLGSRQNQREKNVGRTSDTNQYVDRARPAARAHSVGRSTDKELNKDNISFQSDTGRNFTINTSVKSTFQDFLPSGKPIQVFEYSSDARRQRAASVGRSLIRECSVGRTPSTESTTNSSDYAQRRNDKFKRASSVGRDMVKTARTLQEVKADFEVFRSKLTIQKVDTHNESKKFNKPRTQQEEVKTNFEAFKSKHTKQNVDTNKESKKYNTSQLSPRNKKDQDTLHRDQKRNQNKQNYSPKINYRDPQTRKEHPVEIRSRYKVDRRSDSRGSRKTGIIYSNDNIAKGTIMGSGFGVKNYKIPKIKRVEPELTEVKTKEEETNESVEKAKIKKNAKETDKEIVQKVPKEPTKLVEEPVRKISSKNQNESKISNNIAFESDARVTRSKKRTELNKSKDDVDADDVIVMTRKPKKSVIYDSDSDTMPEKEVTKKSTQGPGSKLNSPSKMANNSKKLISPVTVKESQKDVIEESLDSNFGIDEMEIFSETLESNSVIDNINSLIADLDKDLNSSKTSNDDFTIDIENMMETMNSTEDNSLGDISEVIEKDLKNSNKLQQNLILDQKLNEKSHNISDTTQQRDESALLQSTDRGILLNANQVINITKNSDTKQSATHSETSASETNINKSKKLLEDLVLSKDNEAIVSTTEVDQGTNENNVQTGIDVITTNNVDESIPDSTINKSVSNKTNDGLPDSTNELHCELSSDVTSTYDTAETSNKDSDVQSTTQKDAFNSIGNLLSILQNKSKIKELLAMLGDQSSDNEKIKKKLEKLSEIVSDDEGEEEKPLDTRKEKLLDTATQENLIKKSRELKITDKIETQEAEKKDETSSTPNIEISYDANVDNGQDKSSNSEKTDQITSNDIASKTGTELHSSNQDKNTEITNDTEIFNKISSEETNKTDKLNDKDQSDADDDEPLVKRINKKLKGRTSKGKFKAPNKKIYKNTTRAAPAKTGIKKRGELQKLQEDIKEMFMRDDILNATGIRMCRLTKMVSEKDNVDSGPVVVLEKVKEVRNQDQPIKIRKKPGPKPKNKIIENRAKSPETDAKMNKPKAVTKYKPGPKSKTKSDNTDPYEFDTDSIADTNTTKDSDDDSSDSENGSLASSHSFGSSEVLADTKKKPRRKRRGIGGWQSGIIKPKNRKKKEQKLDTPKNDSPILKSQKPITIPDLNCFTDKSYCFQKNVTTYDCRLCVYSGADIVNHYKKQHPHNEIPLSRMDQKTAELAIQQCEQKNFQALSKISSDKYICRFCHKEFGNYRNVLETFFWHVVSNHTGEFKHLCSECVNVTQCPFNLDIPPPPKDGGQLIGYICQKCNFTQISLENLKTHVIVHHNDEQTEVFTINLAVMSNKAMGALLRRAQAKKPEVRRSLRSNQSVAGSSDVRDDCSDVSESSGHNSECDLSAPVNDDREEKEEEEVIEQKPKVDQLKAKLTFENDEPSDDGSVKMEREDRDESSHSNETLNEETTNTNVSRKGNSDEIVDYPHFKLNYTESGAKEYVCCINGNDSHYKTSLLISMKKHIQSKHSEKWDGYCSVCKVIVTLQGVQSDFRDCLSHFLDKHMDDFPILEKIEESARNEMETLSLPESNTLPTVPVVEPNALSTVTLAPSVKSLSAAIPARVATPPVERTASPSYIAVRPLAELICRDLMRETEPAEQETPIALPKIEAIVCLGQETVPPAQPSPSYPTNAEPTPLLDKPFLYEEVQAEVMSKKHRVVLDTMMSKENLVRVFKCAGRFCSFTTDSPDDALLHASTHQRVGGEGALNCAYCNYDACDNGIDLVMHVFKEHRHCQYCCPMCFYRAAASQLVAVHYAKAHSGAAMLKNVLRSTAALTAPPPGLSATLLTRDVAVQHFVCNHDEGACNFKTYTPGKFIEHLQQRHAGATSHPCHLCPTSPPSPAELVLHLRSHGLKLYQCTWCVRGANNETELLAHAAAAHPDVQPQAYVRIITNKEGGKRVLPLAYLNKSKMPTEDVSPSTTKVNPVKEAERSIELEQLIAHTMMMIDASTSQETNTEDLSEEPVEIPIENLPDDPMIVTDDSDEPTALESLMISTDQNVASKNVTEQISMTADKNDTSETQNLPPVVKAEPAQLPNDLTSTNIICLDSEDESDATEQAPLTPNNEPSSSVNEEVAQKVSTEVSRSSITDDVSITKVTETSTESSEPKTNKLIENVIDLSDDEPAPSTAEKPDQIAHQSIFKCPYCLKIFKTSQMLRRHMSRQCARQDGDTLKCPHQQCKFVAPNFARLLAHYTQAHSGVKKPAIYCSLCSATFHSSTGAKLHIRSVHKVPSYNIAMSVDESGKEQVVIGDAGEPTAPIRISGRKTSTEIQRYQAEPGGRARKTSTELKKRYGIDDIDKLPISPILDSQVYCDLCEFGTKVRLNMVRHLQQHASNTPAPRTAPVNPVPHLETNEMHFDKMVNLASSSAATRAPERPRADEPAVTLKIPPSESSRYPKYVPERQRYTCGARDCSYISVDMAMFRRHWDTLHATEEEYRCVHCPPNQALTTSVSLTAARILGHLRMHDVCLYACSACSYYHYRTHLVEKHISETHKAGSVKVVREEYQPEPAAPAAAPTMDLKSWQCGLCEYSSMLRPKVLNHCATEHQSKMQFKCAHCIFRSSAIENIVKHQSNAHPTLPEDVFYYFYKEGSIPDEDGVPRWQKQRQKLNLEARDVKIELEPEPNPETPVTRDTPVSITLAPIQVNLNIVKEEKQDNPSPDKELSVEDLCKKFGQFCEPDGIKYKCCLCGVVREHSRENMQCHLFEELNYRRWECVICSYKAFHKNGLHEHMASEHSRQFNQPRALPVDQNIEKWVQSVLDHQAKAIESNLINLSVQKVQSERPPAAASPKKPESPRPVISASDTEMQNAFGDFGAPKNHQFACPKCDFTTKDESAMATHLESELTKIRWGCTNCTAKYQTFHEAQYHCKSGHTGQAARPKEAVRDPSLRSGWVKAVVSTQKQFIKCISETNREHSPDNTSDTEDTDQNENSLLVAMYDEPVQMEERPAKRMASHADSDDERLVIDEPLSKKLRTDIPMIHRKCPYCTYNIQNSRYVREHILKEHYNIKPYKCSYCPFDGTRQAVISHTTVNHFDYPRSFITVDVPNTPPGETKSKEAEVIATTSKQDKDSETSAAVAKNKRDSKDTEEVAKKVCLYCEKSVPENETETHTHGSEKAEFAKRGEVVVKCCKCLVLRLSISSLEEHFDVCHPGEKVLDNYAYFKLQVDTREIHCCGHCYKKFKFLRDLKVHHSTSHTSLSLSYTSIPFSHNLHTEGDTEIGKRKAEDAAGPSMKRIAKKSTTKPPNSDVAKKSTTKLPYADLKESSYYGEKPVPLENYRNLTIDMPNSSDSVVEVDVEKLRGILPTDSKVVVKDHRS